MPEALDVRFMQEKESNDCLTCKNKSNNQLPCEDEILAQPAREGNIAALVEYFESGCTDACGAVGIELEHTVVREGGAPVSYSEPHGVQWILRELQRDYPQATFDAEGDLLGVARPCEAVTIEPAAQLELSAGPFSHLADAEKTFLSFESTLDSILSPVGERLITVGYHPTAKAADLELIPKQRYQFMNEYLGGIGAFGPCMMRGSASTQVSIDYSSPADCLRKLRIAYALVPLFSLLCDNAPMFEGAPRKHELVRTQIWRYCDPDRCGLVPGVMGSGFSLQAYAEYVLDTPAILVPGETGEWCYTERTFGEIYAERVMARIEVEHAVSMLFNDVRLKTYIEIRPADALPVPYAMAYAALVKGLFYHAENLDALDELLAGVTGEQVEEAKTALMEKGYEAAVYGRPVAELADAVVALARNGLAQDERAYLEPLAALVAKRTTLATLASEKMALS